MTSVTLTLGLPGGLHGPECEKQMETAALIQTHSSPGTALLALSSCLDKRASFVGAVQRTPRFYHECADAACRVRCVLTSSQSFSGLNSCLRGFAEDRGNWVSFPNAKPGSLPGQVC